MRVDVSAEAGEFASGRGGRLWVWAAYPRVCCWGTPAYMHAATVPATVPVLPPSGSIPGLLAHSDTATRS